MMDAVTQTSVIKALLGIALLISTVELIVVLGKTLYAIWRNDDGEEWESTEETERRKGKFPYQYGFLQKRKEIDCPLFRRAE